MAQLKIPVNHGALLGFLEHAKSILFAYERIKNLEDQTHIIGNFKVHLARTADNNYKEELIETAFDEIAKGINLLRQELAGILVLESKLDPTADPKEKLEISDDVTDEFCNMQDYSQDIEYLLYELTDAEYLQPLIDYANNLQLGQVLEIDDVSKEEIAYKACQLIVRTQQEFSMRDLNLRKNLLEQDDLGSSHYITRQYALLDVEQRLEEFAALSLYSKERE